ncbi:hypothetical protein C1I98_13620 [Spongiactinospora gelatinilytica]|uniref:Uncharacterized protein n=1 Tax=Spongiactinospora gelatinilytica TaxID=2666298 RepID=A0A2W2HN57_9ACTN|nr:hypothetical protein [Spongiactinospora gelatinilytica]PZG47357.1 hypothetical protein C1I98_13620 [Spongiactinospora gelatinilytica]
MEFSPLARRLLALITGTADDASYWPDVSQLTVGLGTPVGGGDADSWPPRFEIDERMRQRVVEPARELIGFLLPADREPPHGRFCVLVAAGLAGMDTEVRAMLAERYGPIALAEIDLLLGWDVERRALFVVPRPDGHPSGVAEWLAGLPGYPAFARTALESAVARVEALQAGEIPYLAEEAFDRAETSVLGRAVRLALFRDDDRLPGLLDPLVRGIAVAPTQARTLPSQRLLFEIARVAEAHPTPEVISALRAAGRITRHGGVPNRLDRSLKRIEAALANRLEVAFRVPDGRVRQAVGDHTAVISTDGEVELSWWQGDKRLRSVPAAVRREHPDEVKRLRELVRQTRQQQATLDRALEAGIGGETDPPYRRLAVRRARPALPHPARAVQGAGLGGRVPGALGDRRARPAGDGGRRLASGPLPRPPRRGPRGHRPGPLRAAHRGRVAAGVVDGGAAAGVQRGHARCRSVRGGGLDRGRSPVRRGGA